MNRRDLLKSSVAMTSTAVLTSCGKADNDEKQAASYSISLAQWSQHKALRAGDLDNLDWPSYVKENFDIDALEWVNSFFADKHDTYGIQPKGNGYMEKLKQRCDDAGTQTLLIMCDRVGQLGNPDSTKRTHAVEGHFAWLEAAKYLGGHSIRVNAASKADLPWAEQVKLCADGLSQLSEKAATMGLNVIVENHGGLSSNGKWLAEVMKTVAMENCGTLPDFGNFYVARNRGDEAKWAAAQKLYVGDDYTIDETGIGFDRYEGTKLLMPFAKGVSAKSHSFDEQGNEVHTDFATMMDIIREAGYSGHIGIEYEGKELSEDEGIMATKRLLEKLI